MASVHKRPHSPFWTMAYRTPDGKRVQRSARTRDRYKALQLALKLEGTDPRDQSREWAESIVADLLAASGKHFRDPTPLSVWLQDWRLPRESTWSDSTRRSWIAIENGIISQIGHIALGDLSRTDVAAYRDHLLAAGRKPKTIRAHIKYLRRVLEEARIQQRITENPAVDLKLPPPSASVKKAFSLAQFKALLNKTDGEWHNLILVAGLVGPRLQDALALRHEDIDRNLGLIRVRRKKNKDTITVPLHEAVSRTLENRPGGVLFPELGALPKTGSRSVSARFREDILPLIDIIQPYASNMGGSKQVTEYSFHSLRHMFITELERNGVSPEIRMMLAGHSDRKVSAMYTHADMEMAQNAIAKLVI